MYKLLIVEDEPPIMRSIKLTFESDSNGMWAIETAMNGKQAQAMLEKESFDVVVTDIKMPIMSGIELAEWIYDNRLDTFVVILSGYSDFEYTRKALEYRVFDYLLKPVSLEAISELNVKLKKELEPKVAHKRIREGTSAIMLACAGAYLLYDSEVMMPGVSFWSDEIIERFMERELRDGEGYIFFNESAQAERYVAIQAGSEKRHREIIDKFYSFISNRELPVTLIYDASVLFEDMGRNFQKLRRCLIKKLILGKSQMIDICDNIDTFVEVSCPYTLGDIEKAVSVISTGNREELRKILSDLFDKMREANSTQEEINDMLNVILDTYVLKNPGNVSRRNTSVKHEFINALAGFVSYNELLDEVLEIMMTLYVDKPNADRYEKLSNEVESYLIVNYKKSISSETLASEFGFVPSYISRIFKRQRGMSPNEFLTKYRIEMAKRHLREQPDLKIREIAWMVGFRDSYYFSKIFKKETGVWPSEYVKATSNN